MEGREIDTKRLLLFFVFMILFIISYQFIAYFFIPKEDVVNQEKVQEKKEIKIDRIILPEKPKLNEKSLFKYESEDFYIEFTKQGGRIYKFIDKKYNMDLITERERELNLLPLEIITGNKEIDRIINTAQYEISAEGNKIVMKASEGDISIRKVVEVNGKLMNIEIDVDGINNKIFLNAGTYPEEPSFYTHAGPVLKIGSDVLRIDVDDIVDEELFTGNILFAGEESRYFFKGFEGKIDSVIVKKITKGEDRFTFTFVSYNEPIKFYAGAKEYARFRGTELTEAIDFGTLKIIVKPIFYMLYWVYEKTGSWTLSIIVLTLIVRILMFPLGYKSTIAMMKMSKLAPKIEEIRNKYKKDPVKMQEEMLKLYKEAGFNPASGCLPILLQIPIFFSLYKVLIITVDLKLERFLWVSSLADKDPFYILPILMGGSMILQQKLHPSPDSRQNLIMYLSAIAFTFLFASFPSGLVFYWTLNNILNILQSYIIKRVMLKSDGK